MEGNAIVANDVLKGIADAIRDGLGTSGGMSVVDMAGNVAKLTEGELDFGVAKVKTRLTSIGKEAFMYCYSLSSVSLPACTSVGDDAIDGCVNLLSVSLPACTSVGNYAFGDCVNLSSVSLPACTSVGYSAFDGCISLSSVRLTSMTVEEVQSKMSFWGVVPAGCTIICKDGEITVE